MFKFYTATSITFLVMEQLIWNVQSVKNCTKARNLGGKGLLFCCRIHFALNHWL